MINTGTSTGITKDDVFLGFVCAFFWLWVSFFFGWGGFCVFVGGSGFCVCVCVLLLFGHLRGLSFSFSLFLTRDLGTGSI